MPENSWTVGIDIGGTKIEMAQVDREGRLGERIRIPTRADRETEQIINDLVEVLHRLQERVGSPPESIGIGIAGQIEPKTGTILFAPNLRWHHVALTSILSKKMEISTFILNDVRAATWGEWLYGAGKGSKHFVCLFLGTGIGSGIVSGGELLSGASNTFGELGHMVVDYDGPLCTCGNRGCFEALAGGWAVAALARRAMEKDPMRGERLLSAANHQVDKISAVHVIQCAQEQDPLAEEIVEQVIQAVIAGCVSIANVLNPNQLIIGGGLGEALPHLITRIQQGVAKRALQAASKDLQVIPAELGNDAGVIGAAAFAQMHREVHK